MMYDYSIVRRSLAMARFVAWLAVLVPVAAPCSAQGGSQSEGASQQPASKDSAPNDPKDKVQIKVFSVGNMKAESVASTLHELFSEDPSLTITADPNTNSVLARGTEKALGSIEAVLARLDIFKGGNEHDATTTIVYYLERIESGVAERILSTLLQDERDARLAVDSRLNCVIVSAPEAVQQLVRQTLADLDSISTAGKNMPKTLILSDQQLLPSSQEEARVAAILAKQHNVDFEFFSELQMAVVRGTESSIQTFKATLENFKQSLQGTRDDSHDQEAVNVTAQITWLLSMPGQAELESGEGLDAIRRKAEQAGIHGLSKIGTLMATSSTDAENPSTFEVTGTTAVADQRFQLSAEGTIARVESSNRGGKFALRLEVSVRTSNSEFARRSSTGETMAKVNMQVEAGQTVVIASAPVHGHPSIFVVELEVPEKVVPQDK